MKCYLVRLFDPHSGNLLQQRQVWARDEEQARLRAYREFWEPRWDPDDYEVTEVQEVAEE